MIEYLCTIVLIMTFSTALTVYGLPRLLPIWLAENFALHSLQQAIGAIAAVSFLSYTIAAAVYGAIELTVVWFCDLVRSILAEFEKRRAHRRAEMNA